MAAIFEKITFTWKGEEYEIPPNQVMKALAKLEDVITMVQMMQYRARGDFPLVKISMGYAAMLRHAGARVTDEEVYVDMFKGEATEAKEKALAAMLSLQELMVPPSVLKEGASPEGKSPDESQRTPPAA
jgi:hypothetical protein